MEGEQAKNLLSLRGSVRYSAAVAITVAVTLMFALCVNGTVNQGSSLEEMLVAVLGFGTVLDEVYMFSFPYIDGGAGLSTEFVVVSVGGISTEGYLVYMGFPLLHSLVGDSGKSVIVAFVAAAGDNSAADELVYVFLVVILGREGDICVFHINAPIVFVDTIEYADRSNLLHCVEMVL